MLNTSSTNSIWHFAVWSRIFVLCLSFISNLIVPDHNASDVFIYERSDGPTPRNNYMLDHIIYAFFGGLIRWDGNYFLHISNYGYSEENMLAFFPLFPFAVRLISLLCYSFLHNFVSYDALLLVISVVLNFYLFIKCALLLYELTCKITKNYSFAYYAAIIFCVNPASIFFTAPYSETLFAFLTYSTILNCFSGDFLTASMLSGLSCATRSNGTLNVGFVIYSFLIFFIRHFTLSLSYVISFTIVLIVLIGISLAPFVLFQLYAYVKFCSDSNDALSSWCNHTVPLAYSYVQSKYWNVGFLKYYELKQIPNFILAAPIIYILLRNGLKKISDERNLIYKVLKFNIISEIRNNSDFVVKNELSYLVTVIHAMLLTVFCVFFVHIQVSTRMLCSSSPVLYWLIAEYFRNNYQRSEDKFKTKLTSDITKKYKCSKTGINNDDVSNCSLVSVRGNNLSEYWKMFYRKESVDTKQLFMIAYCLSYTVIGTILFSNFFPWT